MPRRTRNIPLPEPHLIGLAVGLPAGMLAGWTLPLPAWLRRACFCLAAGGQALAAWATRVSTETDLADPNRLILHGLYAARRNPMHVGRPLAYPGTGAALASVWLLALPPGDPVFTHLVGRHEQKRLRALRPRIRGPTPQRSADTSAGHYRDNVAITTDQSA
jgi:protein-S-isoprenylcysteine O-methyltransferase Ste14